MQLTPRSLPFFLAQFLQIRAPHLSALAPLDQLQLHYTKKMARHTRLAAVFWCALAAAALQYAWAEPAYATSQDDGLNDAPVPSLGSSSSAVGDAARGTQASLTDETSPAALDENAPLDAVSYPSLSYDSFDGPIGLGGAASSSGGGEGLGVSTSGLLDAATNPWTGCSRGRMLQTCSPPAVTNGYWTGSNPGSPSTSSGCSGCGSTQTSSVWTQGCYAPTWGTGSGICYFTRSFSRNNFLGEL
jgi:hypothetical protein